MSGVYRDRMVPKHDGLTPEKPGQDVHGLQRNGLFFSKSKKSDEGSGKLPLHGLFSVGTRDNNTGVEMDASDSSWRCGRCRNTKTFAIEHGLGGVGVVFVMECLSLTKTDFPDCEILGFASGGASTPLASRSLVPKREN